MLFLDLQVQWRSLVSAADKRVAMGGRAGGRREVRWGQEWIKDVGAPDEMGRDQA